MQYEKDVEDYICAHQEQFIEIIKGIFKSDEASFVGRQVTLGKDHRIDLLYQLTDIDKGTPVGDVSSTAFLIVELKNRELIPEDFAQIGRYLSIFDQKLDGELTQKSKGLFVAPCIGEKVKDMMTSWDWDNPLIKFVTFTTSIKFQEADCSLGWKEDYIEKLELDSRVVDTLKEQNDGQPA